MTCAHEHTEPVNAGPTIVGHICVDCRTELPANWGCPDCQWADIGSFGDVNDRGERVPVLIPGIPCPRHGRKP